jgi:endonuclease YncB( thermonuclease family)
MEIPYFTIEGKKSAHCVDVYDGDTATFVFALPRKKWRFRCRMAGYNCAEIRGGSEEEKAAAIIARDALREKILGRDVVLNCSGFDKYGRVLVQVEYEGRNINEEMLAYGAKYNGRGEKKY